MNIHKKIRSGTIMAGVFGVATIALIGNARATAVAPTDYFVEASAQVLDQATDTGAVAGPVAQNTNPATAVYYSTSTSSYNTTGGILVSTGNAAAAADLSAGQLHAAAGATAIYPGGSTVGFPASAIALLGDTLYFSNANASATAFTTVTFTLHVDGYSNDSATFAIGVGPGEIGLSNQPTGFNPAGVRCSDPGVTTDCVQDGYSTVQNYYRGQTVNQDITGQFTFKGSFAAIPLIMELQAVGQYFYTDFSNTAAFTFDTLPDGVSYTTASGGFLSAVPAPSIGHGLPMLLAFGGIVCGGRLLAYGKRCRSLRVALQSIL